MATILITGATDGIGLALAKKYAAVGHQLILVGRRPLASLAAPLFTPQTYCQADLSKPRASDQIANWLQWQQISQIDWLIHNAGSGYFGSVAKQDGSNLCQLLIVNLYMPIRLTQQLFPWLNHGDGQVIFISSVATAVPTPDYATYGASKAALEGFARSLRVEWQGKITVYPVGKIRLWPRQATPSLDC